MPKQEGKPPSIGFLTTRDHYRLFLTFLSMGNISYMGTRRRGNKGLTEAACPPMIVGVKPTFFPAETGRWSAFSLGLDAQH